MNNKIFIGRASEFTPQAVRSLVSLAVQKALELNDNDYAVSGVEVTQLQDDTWGVFLLAEGAEIKAPQPAPRRRDPEEEEWEYTKP